MKRLYSAQMLVGSILRDSAWNKLASWQFHGIASTAVSHKNIITSDWTWDSDSRNLSIWNYCSKFLKQLVAHWTLVLHRRGEFLVFLLFGCVLCSAQCVKEVHCCWRIDWQDINRWAAPWKICSAAAMVWSTLSNAQPSAINKNLATPSHCQFILP